MDSAIISLNKTKHRKELKMGFGDFAMGYLVGQSFSGPNHIPDGNKPYSEWSSQAKKDFEKICDEA